MAELVKESLEEVWNAQMHPTVGDINQEEYILPVLFSCLHSLFKNLEKVNRSNEQHQKDLAENQSSRKSASSSL